MKFLAFPPALLTVVCVMAAAGADEKKEGLTWNSARMSELKDSWEALNRSLPHQTKDNYAKNEKERWEFLKERLSQDDLRDLADSLQQRPIAKKEWTHFHSYVLDHMFALFLSKGERDRLVGLLAAHCPDHFGSYYIEAELCLIGRVRNLKDPVLILPEAFARCRDPEVRSDIIKILHRTFSGWGIRGNDDAEFVQNAVQWYQREKEQIVPDTKSELCIGRPMGSSFNPLSPLPADVRQEYRRYHFFRRKPSPRSNPSDAAEARQLPGEPQPPKSQAEAKETSPRKEPAVAENGKEGLRWDSPKIIDLKKEWETLERGTEEQFHSNPAYAVASDVTKPLTLNALLRKRLRDEELRQLAADCNCLAVSQKDRSPFENAVLPWMVEVLVLTGDRETLVTLLSRRCPTRVFSYHDADNRDLEWYLVSQGWKLKDPILILGEAYAKCEVPAVRQDIVFCLRCGFAGAGVTGKDDAEFVKNALQWYDQHKGRLIFNSRYFENASGPPGMYEKYPLFEDKEVREKRERSDY